MYFWIHLIVAIALTIGFLFQFIKHRQIYQLLFVIWVPTTLLTYIPAIGSNSTYRLVLGGFQLFMFILVIFFMFRRDPKQRAAVRAAMKAELLGENAPPEEAVPAEAGSPTSAEGEPSGPETADAGDTASDEPAK